MTKPTIFVTASLPMMIRNWVRTDLLLNMSQKFRIILLTPLGKDHNFVKSFSSVDLLIENLPFQESFLSLLGRRLFSIASMRRFSKTKKVDTLLFKEVMLRQTRFWYALLRTAIDILNRRKFMEKFGWWLWKRYWRKSRAYADLFNKFQPKAILSTHPYLETEWPLLYHAQERSIPLYAFIHSWDNPSSRGELFFKFKRLMVWSEYVKDILHEYYPNFGDHDIVITGAPQYETFFHKNWLEPRDDFFKRHGIDPERRLVLFGCGGPLFPSEVDIVKFLIKLFQSGPLKHKSHLWVRFYGSHDYRPSLGPLEDKAVTLEKAPSEFWGTFRVERDWKGKEDDLKNYLNLLYHSSVVVCSASTITLDALVMNKPVVNIAFDGSQRKDFMHSVRRIYFGFTHYQRVVRSEAVKIVLNYKELQKHLNRYIEEPSLDEEARLRLMNELCGPVDDKISQRVISLIASEVAAE